MKKSQSKGKPKGAHKPAVLAVPVLPLAGSPPTVAARAHDGAATGRGAPSSTRKP